MKISLIVAMGENRVIGVDNRMPWHLSADLKRFKQITMGKPLVMGRRTHESIGRPLPGRKNIVLTSDRAYVAPGCVVVHTLRDALGEADADEVMVIGGSSLYETLLPKADRLYLTLIHREFVGDTFFPEFEWKEWSEIERLDVTDDPDSGLSYSFLVLERKAP
ncbi:MULTISPECIES: dihydrofolate reductase [Methylocaldum]|jgi:dihydrofolate reductase|uniref:dihydrofolate reductase n=1 Tax=unclassified Methylocaldum TaxID=2622260 RepID=UPI00098A5B95|nr:dihydrofolate reductase [Methylocaldum sp. 14B]MVF21489.1 dihydrofolate reductase [Methylocaldum sp. BRCS4]